MRDPLPPEPYPPVPLCYKIFAAIAVPALIVGFVWALFEGGHL